MLAGSLKHSSAWVDSWCCSSQHCDCDSGVCLCVKMEESIRLLPALSLLSYQLYSATEWPLCVIQVSFYVIISSKLTTYVQSGVSAPDLKFTFCARGHLFPPAFLLSLTFCFFPFVFSLLFNLAPAPHPSPSLSLQYISVSARGEEKKWSRQEIYPVERQVWINKEEV